MEMEKTLKCLMKYGFQGIEICVYSISTGAKIKNITLSKDNHKIFEFLGYDFAEFEKGFSNIHDIFNFITSGKYFNAEHFQMDKLSRIDRKRNKKRQTFQDFLTFINDNSEMFVNGYSHDKKNNLSLINSFFPDANLIEELSRLKIRDEENQAMSKKFNGKLIMAIYPDLKGKELGSAMSNFKATFEDYRGFILSNNYDVIMAAFDTFMFNKTQG